MGKSIIFCIDTDIAAPKILTVLLHGMGIKTEVSTLKRENEILYWAKSDLVSASIISTNLEKRRRPHILTEMFDIYPRYDMTINHVGFDEDWELRTLILRAILKTLDVIQGNAGVYVQGDNNIVLLRKKEDFFIAKTSPFWDEGSKAMILGDYQEKSFNIP